MKQWECRVWDGRKMDYRYDEISCWNGILLPEGDSEILLYTGYKDRNKKKIYQMDIVEVHEETLMAVVWHAGGFCLIAEEAMLESIGWYLPEGFGNIPEHAMVVKGNLYQDKHILKRFKS